ncbi:MAG: hypothetical protein IPK42_05135 [Betaproteobacteria bacterium]|nr:hypothetical protein [Betaproteobacteria bacterium]
MNIASRVAALERAQTESGPLVLFGGPTPEQREAIEEARRIGRLLVQWPVLPPLIEQNECREGHHDDT